TAASFATYTMSHAAVTGVACSACHSGAYVSQGTSGAQGKSATHVATTAECSTCHNGTTTWAGATFVHAATDTNCVSCHVNGGTATGMTTPPHIPTTTIQCGNCHSNTAASFTTYTMNHAAAASEPCGGCHHATYAKPDAAGRGAAAAHPPTRAKGGQHRHHHRGNRAGLPDDPGGGRGRRWRPLPHRRLCEPGDVRRAGQERAPRRDHGRVLDLPQEDDGLA